MVRSRRGVDRIQPATERRTTRSQAQATNPPAPTYAAFLQQERALYAYSALHHHPPMAPRTLSFSITPRAGAAPFAVWAPASGTGGPRWCMWCFEKHGGILTTILRDISVSELRPVSVNGNGVGEENWHQCREQAATSDKCTWCRKDRNSGCVWEYDQMAGDFYDIKVMHELVRNLPKAVREQESLLVALRAAWVTFGEAVEEHKEDENGEGGPFPYFATSYKWDADDEANYLGQAKLRRQANGLAYLRAGEPGYDDWSAAKRSFVDVLGQVVSDYRQTSQEDLRVTVTLDEARNSYAS